MFKDNNEYFITIRDLEKWFDQELAPEKKKVEKAKLYIACILNKYIEVKDRRNVVISKQFTNYLGQVVNRRISYVGYSCKAIVSLLREHLDNALMRRVDFSIFNTFEKRALLNSVILFCSKANEYYAAINTEDDKPLSGITQYETKRRYTRMADKRINNVLTQ